MNETRQLEDMKMNPATTNPKLLIPVLAMAGASAVCLAVFGARVLWTGNWSHLFLVLLNPLDLLRDVAHRVLSLPADFRPALVAALFSVFVFLTYVLLYSLTHLPPVPAKASEEAGS